MIDLDKYSDLKIHKYILDMTKEKFLKIITSKDIIASPAKIKNIKEKNYLQLSEMISLLNINEKENVLKNRNEVFSFLDNMIFSSLPIDKVMNLFFKNPSKYKEEISSTILAPIINKQKDTLICTILSNKEFRKYFTKEELAEFKNQLGDELTMLDEKYNIDLPKKEIINQVARYIANIDIYKVKSINNGIIKKVNPNDLYKIYLQVNRGLRKINSEEIEISHLMEIFSFPFEYAVYFLNNTTNKTNEELMKILIHQYPEYKKYLENTNFEKLFYKIKEYGLPNI